MPLLSFYVDLYYFSMPILLISLLHVTYIDAFATPLLYFAASMTLYLIFRLRYAPRFYFDA